LSVLELEAEIKEKAEEEASRILENTRQEVEKIIAEANRKASALRDEKMRTLMRALDTEERAELAISRMDRKGELLELRSRWADRVFEEAEKRIRKMAEAGKPEYREVLSKLVLEGIVKIKGTKFLVEANPRDTKSIREESRSIIERSRDIKGENVELQVETSDAMSLGGSIVSTQDMTRYFNNTFEARLSRARQSLLGEVYKILLKTGE